MARRCHDWLFEELQCDELKLERLTGNFYILKSIIYTVIGRLSAKQIRDTAL